MTFILLLFLPLFENAFSSTEPCETNNYINDHKRSTANREGTLCDSFLSTNWYRVTSGAGELMPTQCIIDGYRCGTHQPIWLSSDNIPAGETIYPPMGVVYNRTCYSVNNENCKDKTYTILIKNCTLYYVYYLRPTVGCNSAYCFGSEKPCDEGQSSETGFTPNCTNVFPSFVATPNVKVGFHTERVRFRGNDTKINKTPKFICEANDATHEYNYDIQFIINDVPIPHAIFRNVSKNNIQNAALLQHHWNTTFRPNMLVKCSIAARFIDRGVSGIKIYSDYYFAGLKVVGGIEINGFLLDEGETKNIQVQSTMPIGCSYTEGKEVQKVACFVSLHNGVPGYQLEENCVQSLQDGNVEFQPQQCRLLINHDNWNSIHNISITANADNYVNIENRIAYLRLFTTATVSSTEPLLNIWSSIVLPDIKVFIHDTDEAILRESCYSHNDPHMRTFDGEYWEFHKKPGEYILYRHNSEPQQINVYVDICQAGQAVLCNCGIAIRSADSSFVANFCETKNHRGERKTNRYAISRLCDAQNLLVEEPKDDHYKVTFPTGTVVEFNFKRTGTFAGIHAIDIKPSQFDFELTSGLCGPYNGNKKDDTTMRDGTNATSFEESWRVESGESFFKASGELPALHYTVQEFCTCSVSTSSVDMQPPNFKCRFSDEMKECRKENAPSSVFRATCVSSAHRTKRSSRIKRSEPDNDGIDGKPPQYDMITQYNYSNLEAPEWRNGLTEEKAREICRRNIVDLPAHTVCTTFVPTVSSENIIEECVKDMKAVGSDSFMNASLESYENRCFQTAKQMEHLTKVNTTDSSGKSTSILDVISQSTCSQNCSGRGTCKEGKCICNFGSYGGDCSMDITQPPQILKEGFDEHCDITAKACRKIPIPGSDFIAVNLTCKFDRFVVSNNNSQINDSTSTIHSGNYSSSFMMYCKLAETRVKRSTTTHMATGYYISVSNDGSTFTEKLTFLIYNPSCYQCNTSIISCTKLDTCPEQDSVQNESDSHDKEIAISTVFGVLGLFGICVIVFVIVKKKCIRRHDRVNNSRRNIYDSTEMNRCPVGTDDLYLGIGNSVPDYDEIEKF